VTEPIHVTVIVPFVVSTAVIWPMAFVTSAPVRISATRSYTVNIEARYAAPPRPEMPNALASVYVPRRACVATVVVCAITPVEKP
jgi:hypothetical protein